MKSRTFLLDDFHHSASSKLVPLHGQDSDATDFTSRALGVVVGVSLGVHDGYYWPAAALGLIRSVKRHVCSLPRDCIVGLIGFRGILQWSEFLQSPRYMIDTHVRQVQNPIPNTLAISLFRALKTLCVPLSPVRLKMLVLLCVSMFSRRGHAKIPLMRVPRIRQLRILGRTGCPFAVS